MPRDPRWDGPRAGAVTCLQCFQCHAPPDRLRGVAAAMGLALALLLLGSAPCRGQSGELLGTPQMRAEALRAIPFDELNDATRTRLLQVAGKPSIYRRMPVQMIECDPDLYVFLIRYPEVIVSIWRLMEVTKVQIKRTGAYAFEASDGAGTISRVELVYGRPDLHIFYARGYYEGPLFGNRIEGDCVLILRSAYSQQDERVSVTNALDVFVRTDHPGAEIVLKTLHPLMGKAADYNFVETTKFIGQVSLASERNGPGIERLAQRLSIEPAVREAFTRHADVAYQRGLLRQNLQITPAAIPAPKTAPGAVVGTGEATPVAGEPALLSGQPEEISSVLQEPTTPPAAPAFRR